MFSRIRSSVLLCTAAITALTLHAQSVQPAKVAIINFQKAAADTQEIKKAQAALQAKYQPRQQQIDALQRELQNIQQQLNTPNLTPDREAQLRADGTQKQKQAQRLNEDLTADFNAERQDVLGRAGRQMTDIVKKLAEERGFDVVLDVTNTVYAKPALDITPDATAAYDKAYPAK